MKLVFGKYILAVVLMAILDSVASQDCFTLIKKSWQCRFFDRLMIQKPPKTGHFIQNPVIDYDLVSEPFTLTQKLNIKYQNFSAAATFFQKTFKDLYTKNKCFYFRFLNRRGVYSPIFTKSGYLGDFVRIVNAFKEQFEPYRLNSLPATSKVAAYWNQWGSSNMPTLTDFCIRNDYTSNIYSFYNTTEILCDVDENEFAEMLYSCTYTTLIKRRTVTVAPNDAALLVMAQCSVRPAVSCGRNVTRFWSLTDWTDFWPRLKVPTGKNKMIAYFDRLTIGDKIPKSQPRNFSYLYADWSNTSLFVRAYMGDQEGAGLATCNSTVTILNTTNGNLVVEGTLMWSPVLGCFLKRVIVSSFFPTLGQTSRLGFDIQFPSFKRNKTYIKDPAKKSNYAFRRYYLYPGFNRTELNEMQWNAFFAFENYGFEAYVDKKQLVNATGILVDGFEDLDVLPLSHRRKREAVDESACRAECHLVKKRWTGPVLDDSGSGEKSLNGHGDWEAFVRHHASSSARCVSKCSSR